MGLGRVSRGGSGKPPGRRYTVRLSLWITEEMDQAVAELATEDDRDVPDMYRRCIRVGMEAIQKMLRGRGPLTLLLSVLPAACSRLSRL